MELLKMYAQLGLSPAVYRYGEAVLEELKDRFAAIDQSHVIVEPAKILFTKDWAGDFT